MNKPKTRFSASHSVFGNPLSEFPTSELPTRMQVGKHIVFLKESKFSNNKELISHLAQTIIDLWHRAGIPPQPTKTVKTKLQRFLQEGSEVSKRAKRSDRRTRKFKDSLHSLFDISACQCKDIDACRCAKDMKVPAREREFLLDQRTLRKMQIGAIDKPVTAMMKRRMTKEYRMKERENDEKRRKLESEAKANTAMEELEANTAMGEMELSTKETSESEEEKDWALEEASSDDRNIVQIPTVALEAERYGISNRAAAAISTAALVDYGVVSHQDRSNIIDHHKVWRARQQLRKDMRKKRIQNDEEIVALFFDGRKDSTLVKEKKGSKWYSSKKTEDHYVLVGEPGTVYLRHITQERATGSAIADGLYSAIEEMELEEKIMAVGADSTAVNTGHKSGAIHLLECKLHRPLQWIVCCLHLNELPLRHLCKELIGSTEGPNQWRGPIGSALLNCETLPKVQFNMITDGDILPDVETYNLSRDQAYLYKIIIAIRTGIISDDLLREKPGPISMARWLTTASRICRLYVGTAQPSTELCFLTHFIVTNYGPMWFKIKCRPQCTEGPMHFLEQIKAQKLLSPHIRKVTWPVIQRNAYWAHQENVLLAMLASQDEATRRAAVDKIKAIRQAPQTSRRHVRQFRAPVIQQAASTLRDLLPPLEECLLEPPLTSALPDEELDKVVQQSYSSDIPCHSQGVERCVRMVTEASNAVYGAESRDGYIRAVIKSRSCMPSFETKQDFCDSFHQ